MAFEANQTGRCPHCKIGVRFEGVVRQGTNSGAPILRLRTGKAYTFDIISCGCPECGHPIISARVKGPDNAVIQAERLLWPSEGSRVVPLAVEAENPALAADFREASAVSPISQKASAALSRRCLQTILVDKGGAKKRDLVDQIDEVLDKLPTELAHNVDAIRHVGNFAAHPMKSKSTGEIAEVEEGEAEWCLDVLEQLFDYYYVAPAVAAERRAALNKKLEELGKPALKAPPV